MADILLLGGAAQLESQIRLSLSDFGRIRHAENGPSIRLRRKAFQVLKWVGLQHRMNAFPEQLSGGEQQRIAFARALVQKPEWLFLDEATSALDEETEARLYALLRERLPGTTVVSVGHRSTLRAFHARRLVVTPNGTGAATVTEVAVQP